MTKKRPGGVAGPEIAEVFFKIGRRAAAAEGISEVAAFAVEQAARLVGAGHAALLQIEGESLLPIATYGWPGALQGTLDSGQVRVGDDEATAEGVEPVSLFCTEVVVQGRLWAVLAVHQVAAAARTPRDAEYRLRAVAQILAFTRELEVANRRLSYVVNHDALTGLPNRQYFVDRLREAQAFPIDGLIRAVICLDMDRFFQVNDVVGYGAGDGLLQDVAARLRRATRPSDLAARQIGDRFVVLCDGLPSEASARAEAERLRRSITGAVRIGPREIVVSASAGVALADPETSAEDLLWEAELAMLEAKNAGRNRVSLYEPSFHDRLTMRRHLEIDLRDAIHQEGLVLHYQPIVDLTDQTMIRAEALIRWSHPDRGLVAPNDFMPVADESRLVTAITEWVLNTACTNARQWQGLADSAGAPAPGVSVNLSAQQVVEPGLVQRVSAALEHSGLDPRMLTLEVNESVAMSESDRLPLAVRKLHEIGVNITIDNFGSGYLALGHLRRLQVDAIKIDRPFVQGLGVDPDDAVIVGIAMALARALNIEAAAEGVETLAQANELERLGCRVAQGYLFGKPEPHDAICAAIRRLPRATLSRD